jgi:ferric-dicitrate binding protein FerR (iron transport regulator)
MFFEECIQTGHLFSEAQERQRYDQEINIDELWSRLTTPGIPARSYQFRTTTARRRLYAAAVLLIIVSTGGLYIWLQPTPKEGQRAMPAVVKRNGNGNELSPGINNTTLTLANGSEIILDSSREGILAVEGKTRVIRNTNGTIEYSSTDNDHRLVYNTLAVPRGGDVVQVTLADGTKVWLNAASSLRYPVAFDTRERKVEVTGEAYFEVTHNPAIPFKVIKGNIGVAVLGTHFNVNAYDEEEQLKVTLLQGAVTVSAANNGSADNKTLAPGQQAVVTRKNEITVSRNTNEQVVMAWKNGLFYFDNTSIDVIIREMKRWYDVSIEYDPALKNLAFNGQISRYSNAAKVLKLLATTQSIHYRIDGRKIYLTP